jgi:methyl-accepting chemotaxis protein
MESTKRSATSLASTFGRLYANYFLLIRGAKGFINAIKGTSDYIEAFNYYNVAFGKIASEWDKDWEKYGYENAEAYADSFTERMQESLSKMSGLEVVIDADGKGLLTSTNLQNLGLNIREITQYASQLASVTNSVGQTGEVSLAAARSFTKLGADLASLFNIDYSDVMKNLQSGIIGQSRSLYKYGIDITNATLSTYAFELGLKKSVSEMTQAEKMQLRMIAILDQSKVAWGDLANTINSPSNMLRQFKNNLKEVGMVLGQLFLPLMERVMPVVNGATIAIKNFLINLATLLGIKIDFDAFGEGFTDLGEDANSLADGLDNITDSAKKANKQLGKFDELNNLTTSSGANVGGGLDSSIDLTNEIIKASEEYEKAWNEAFKKMESRSAKFAKNFEKKLKPVTQIFERLFKGDFAGAGEATTGLVTGIYSFFSKAIDKVEWEKLGNKIGDFLEGIDWLKVIKEAFKLKFNIWKAIAEVWFGAFEAAPIETAVFTAIGALKFTGLGSLFSAKIASAMGGATIGAALLASFSSFGGLAGLLTMDLAVVLGAGTLPEIALTFATGLGGSILAAMLCYGLGEKISAAIWPENEKYIKMSWDEQWESIFKSFKDGTFLGAFELMGNDLKQFFEDCFTDIWKSVEEIFINPFKEFITDISKVIAKNPNFFKNLITTVPSVVSPVFPKFANGGFPEDGLFMANRGELVGQFSNGKTAVATNQQITQGIADAVYPAVYNAIVAGMGNSGNGGNTLKIEGDPRGMFKVFVDEWNAEARRTQRNPVTVYNS